MSMSLDSPAWTNPRPLFDLTPLAISLSLKSRPWVEAALSRSVSIDGFERLLLRFSYCGDERATL
jgi:hypothetical protein